jgi:hypothetical protein
MLTKKRKMERKRKEKTSKQTGTRTYWETEKVPKKQNRIAKLNVTKQRHKKQEKSEK